VNTVDFVGIQVVRCEGDKLDDNVDGVSVLVPQMTRISRETISKAKKLRMILQFGVGLEGWSGT
jgi:phosphoglycerate dehydrogenase-like enzyme